MITMRKCFSTIVAAIGIAGGLHGVNVATAAAEPEFRAGAAAVDITPTVAAVEAPPTSIVVPTAVATNGAARPPVMNSATPPRAMAVPIFG